MKYKRAAAVISAVVTTVGITTAATTASAQAAPISPAAVSISAVAPVSSDLASDVWHDIKWVAGMAGGAAGWLSGGGSFSTIPWDDINRDVQAFIE